MEPRSGRSKKSSKPELPDSFVNRSLGAYGVPDALREDGWPLVTMREIYGEQGAQNLTGDSLWIEEVSARGLVILSKDSKSLCGVHRADIEEHGAKVFILPQQNLNGDEMAERFIRHKYRIARKAEKDGPMIYRLYPTQIKRIV
jgi:hypothetical protein